MRNVELEQEIRRVALESFDAGQLLGAALPDQIRPLDLWSDGRYASVLFWADRNLDLAGFGTAVLINHTAQRGQSGKWRSTGRTGMSSYEPQHADELSSLQRLASRTHDALRITMGIAGNTVAAIRLRDENSERERSLGVDKFFLLGITHVDPITCVYAVNSNGEQLPGEPFLL